MKKIFLFALVIVCSVMSFAQMAEEWRIHPDDAKYKIYGHFETTFPDSSVAYELTQVKPLGLSFPVRNKYLGKLTNRGNIYFTFDSLTYTGSPDLENIALWTYEESLNKWIPDVETGKQEGDVKNTNEMTIMLVLDCSTSLLRKDKQGRIVKNGLTDVINSAKSFIDVMLAYSEAGNIHIGIIGFSTMQLTRTLELQALNPYSADKMKKFISSFEPGNGTALYRSFDDAVDKTQNYVRGLDKFAGAAIVTFTDGLDNGSNNFDKKIGSKQAYFQYIKNEVLYKSIGGYGYQSYTIFVPGGEDVKDSAVERKIVDEMKTMAKRDDRFFYVNNTSELEGKFKDIARNLIDSWKVLSCFISAGQNGNVCWTFGKKENVPAPTPTPLPEVRNGRNIFVGLNGTIGLPISLATLYYYDYGYYAKESIFGFGMNLKFGIDFAYPVADKFAIGMYMNIGGGFGMVPEEGLYVDRSFDFKFGVLMLAGDVNDRPFIIGLSPCLGFGTTPISKYVPFEMRFGRVVKKHLYITGNLNIGIPTAGGFVLEPGISIGYHFGDKLKTK